MFTESKTLRTGNLWLPPAAYSSHSHFQIITINSPVISVVLAVLGSLSPKFPISTERRRRPEINHRDHWR